MRKVIDLCLDMPMGAEALTNMLGAMCLDPLYRGYKKTYGAGVAAQVGLTVEEIDAIYESEGRDGFLRIIREAAEKHAVKLAEFVRHLDEVGVEWGITCDGDHDNRKTAELVQAFPKKFKGFIYVDPNKGEEAVRELEMCVKEYGLHALYLTAFRTKLNAADRKNYPLYSKACELGIPVHIYSSLNLSKAVPYDIGHPRYIDQVARDFPELKIMADSKAQEIQFIIIKGIDQSQRYRCSDQTDQHTFQHKRRTHEKVRCTDIFHNIDLFRSHRDADGYCIADQENADSQQDHDNTHGYVSDQQIQTT